MKYCRDSESITLVKHCECRWVHGHRFFASYVEGKNFCDFQFASLGNNFFPGKESTQRAHDVKMTSYQRRCDVMTSHRR